MTGFFFFSLHENSKCVRSAIFFRSLLSRAKAGTTMPLPEGCSCFETFQKSNTKTYSSICAGQIKHRLAWLRGVSFHSKLYPEFQSTAPRPKACELFPFQETRLLHDTVMTRLTNHRTLPNAATYLASERGFLGLSWSESEGTCCCCFQESWGNCCWENEETDGCWAAGKNPGKWR